MKERPILFCGEMVRAILEGRKTQTRRMVRSRIVPVVEECFRVNGKWCNHTFGYDLVDLCPYGHQGDRLWVKETFSPQLHLNAKAYYRATDGLVGVSKWTPSIFMPRKLSRITLEITGVRVERVKDITPDDCRAEGQPHDNNDVGVRYGFGQLWNRINGNWDDNPWVWVIEFKLL